jgi:hypothetical protein
LPRTAFGHNPQLPLPPFRPPQRTWRTIRSLARKRGIALPEARGDRRLSRRRRTWVQDFYRRAAPATTRVHDEPGGTTLGAIVAPAHDLTLNDILAAHLETAITRIDALDSCVDLLARHVAGALDRIELLESRLWHRSDGAATREDQAPLSDASRSATLQRTPPAIEHARVRPTLTLLPDLRDPRAAAAAVAASPTTPTPTTPGRSERFSDMTMFLHAVVSAQRRTATR